MNRWGSVVAAAAGVLVAWLIASNWAEIERYRRIRAM